MKRVGIVTFHRADNYGAVLQNYALQKAVGDWCNVETVNYKCDFYKKAIETGKVDICESERQLLAQKILDGTL